MTEHEGTPQGAGPDQTHEAGPDQTHEIRLDQAPAGKSSASSVAVIVGGASGIGLETASRLAPDHHLLIADISPERVAAATGTLRASGARVTGAVVDVTDPVAVGELAARAAGLGALGVLLCTAGLSPHMAPPARILEVNLVGTANVLSAFLGLAHPGTVVVCMSSVSGHRDGVADFDQILGDPRAPGFYERLDAAAGIGDDSSAAYGLSKRGVMVLCELGAREWGQRGGRIVTVSPGVIDTPMSQSDLDTNEPARAFIGSTTPPRLGRPDEVAAVIEFLVSPRASFVTGCDLRVDGGGLATLMRHGPPEGATVPSSIGRKAQATAA